MISEMLNKKAAIYLVVVVSIFLTSVVGSYLTSLGLGEWYGSLNLPDITPQGGFIGAVWTTIYILTAISAIIFYSRVESSSQKRWVSLLLGANLLINVFWSYIFFTANLIGLAIWIAAILGTSVVGLIFLMWPVSKTSAVLLVPYASWSFFATYLNYLIWSLN